LAHLRQAAGAGSLAAQFRLGQIYGKGIGVEANVREAEKYYRLCAASATPECQYQLGKLLLESPKPDRVQAVAWLELADAHGSAEAHELAVIEAPKLLPEQSFAVERLRVALEHKR